MVRCIRCNEEIVHFSPTACVCSTCHAVDDLSRHDELPRIKASRPQEYKAGEWVDMVLEQTGYYK